MPTLRVIGEHLDLSHVEVHTMMGELGIDWRSTDLATIRVLYLRRLRGAAAGQKAQDGTDLVAARARNEQLDGQLKELELAERRGQLVNLELLEPELRAMFGAFKTELLSMIDKLSAEIDLLHGINIDPEFLEEHINGALRQIARYDPGRKGFIAPVGGANAAGRSDVDGRVGAEISEDVIKG